MLGMNRWKLTVKVIHWDNWMLLNTSILRLHYGRLYIMTMEWFLNWIFILKISVFFFPFLTSAVIVVLGGSSWIEDYTEKWEKPKLWIFIQEIFGFCQLGDLLELRSRGFFILNTNAMLVVLGHPELAIHNTCSISIFCI